MSMKLPEGFENVQSSRSAGWWNPSEGATLQGILMGVYNKKGGEGEFIQVRLTKPTRVKVKEADGEYVEVKASEGLVVNVDVFAAIRDLSSLLNKPEETWEIFVGVVEKEEISGGRSYWRCEVGKRAVRNQA